MLEIRRSHERGHANHGWLDSYHSFSFASYHDEENMQYSVLRVINEDVIAGGTGFGMHAHQDMEIVTYMLSGELRHQDSMGNTSVISQGDVQRMTAGTGVRHSEFNAATNEPVHLLQIWITPAENGLTPSYEEKHFADEEKHNQWCLVVSPDGRDESIKIHQDVDLYASIVEKEVELNLCATAERCHYLQVVKGEVIYGDHRLNAGDALKISTVDDKTLLALTKAELLWFDLPKM